MQNKLGNQIFPKVTKNVYEPDTKTIKDHSEDVTETYMETFEENNKAIADSQSHVRFKIAGINGELLEIKNDWCFWPLNCCLFF